MSSIDFTSFLKLMAHQKASDLFITAGMPPSMKVHGKISPITQNPLTPQQSRDLVLNVMTPMQREEFEKTHECNFAIGVAGVGRFRFGRPARASLSEPDAGRRAGPGPAPARHARARRSLRREGAARGAAPRRARPGGYVRRPVERRDAPGRAGGERRLFREGPGPGVRPDGARGEGEVIWNDPRSTS